MYCPKCSTNICLCDQCKRIDRMLTETVNSELFTCKGCKLARPDVWWEALQLDVNTEFKLPEENKEPIKPVVEEVPEEISGSREAPWNG